ncbi:MAG TPA: M56 family metallopeptidase [Bryobacteraceae bacterium]|nr:M56 family metallopeptidase [Bryobacteraceae bacterium]
MSSLTWTNLVAYSLQVGLVVGLASFVPSLLRLRAPRARLVYLQILLGACLLLPIVQPWRQEIAGGNIQISTTLVSAQEPTHASGWNLPWRELGMLVLAAGIAIRLGSLILGFWRLRGYRKNALRLDLAGHCPAFLSDDITSPVTFGFLKPVVLLPANFPEMTTTRQQAILCHEFLHVERGDWLMIVAEEIVRAIFWFHPAIWWVLGEIQLAREQAVDHEVVRRTQAREEYVDALLEIAGAQLHPDLAPAPLFLRKRHLKQRVVSIFKEVPMSKTKWITRLALGLAILVTTCWLVTGTFPLAAAPQASDTAGVTVDIGPATLIHRTAVIYPEAARRKGVQGTVVVEATLDASGNVTDARVVSGPEELRRAALDSVLQWHFADGSAGAVRPVNITFKAEGTLSAPAAGLPVGMMHALAGRQIKSINVLGLSAQARTDLLASLPVHEGDTLSADSIGNVVLSVHKFDEHLRLTGSLTAQGEASLQIASPNYLADSKPEASQVPSKIRVGGGVMQAKLVSQAHPVYPPDAKAARIQGVVKLSAVIGKDGSIESLEVISGHPLLVPPTLEAVKQWKYEPTFLNGEPVAVMTQIDVNYTLSQ